MPTVTGVSVFVNLAEQWGPRELYVFNYPQFVVEVLLLFFGYYSIIRSIRTVMLSSCLAYFAFALSFAYEEVLLETRDVMDTADFNFKYREPPMRELLPPYTKNGYMLNVAAKYARIIGTLMFIAIGLALYSLRRIRIMRIIGNLKNDEHQVIYKKV